jgi:hypothetical protein
LKPFEKAGELVKAYLTALMLVFNQVKNSYAAQILVNGLALAALASKECLKMRQRNYWLTL